MTTMAQSIAKRHIEEQRKGKVEGGGSFKAVFEDLLMFLVAPFLGLIFAVAYGFVGMTTVFCYGLKAVGIRCGLFR